MKFGVREICDVVLKAKTTQKVGDKVFYRGEPVLYFDTLKTSTMEGAATTVYAQGGRGNTRLVAWEGERTVTFTMEDALISPEGFMILSGAGLVKASESKPIYQHVTETIDRSNIELSGNALKITLSNKPYMPAENPDGNYAYVMLVKDGEIISEPYIPSYETLEAVVDGDNNETGDWTITVEAHANYDDLSAEQYTTDDAFTNALNYDSVIVDYYVARTGRASQIEITADKFGGNYYLEASTLFRDQSGVDMPAEFIIPNCKIQSNFTFTMASSGDPSTFTFTMDAFPDFTRFDKSKKVLAAIQIIETDSASDLYRKSTVHSADHDVILG